MAHDPKLEAALKELDGNWKKLVDVLQGTPQRFRDAFAQYKAPQPSQSPQDRQSPSPCEALKACLCKVSEQPKSQEPPKEKLPFSERLETNLKERFSTLGKTLDGWFKGMGDKLGGGLGKMLEKVFDGGRLDFKNIKNVLRESFNELKSIGVALLRDLIKLPIATLLETLNDFVLKPILSALSDVLISAAKVAWSFIASLFHDGGIAGEGSATRPVPVSAFSGAQRFHLGGLPGLTSGEVPAILMRGEEVLTRRDPRHRANLALSARNDNLSMVASREAVNVTYNIDARGADAGVEARIRLAMRESEARTINAVRELANRGGSYAKTLGRRA